MGDLKATPGPWFLSDTTIYALDETGNCNRFHAAIQGGWTWRGYGRQPADSDRTSETELLANAYMMWAAPDFADIAARAQYLANTRGGDYGSLSQDELLGFMVEYDEALAKARGEHPQSIREGVDRD